MEIEVNRLYTRRISPLPRYDICLDNKNTHYAQTKEWVIPFAIELFTNNADDSINLLLTIKRRLSFVPDYIIKMVDGATMEFKTISFWRGHFQCRQGVDVYDIYAHKGGTYSIFSNNTQIAFWNRKILMIPGGQLFGEKYIYGYTIVADKDSNDELLMAFCIMIDRYLKIYHPLLFISIGRIWPEIIALISSGNRKVNNCIIYLVF